MKEIVVSRNSWHYRLVEKICIQPNDDICGYTRDVACSLFVLSVGVAVACGVVASFGPRLLEPGAAMVGAFHFAPLALVHGD